MDNTETNKESTQWHYMNSDFGDEEILYDFVAESAEEQNIPDLLELFM